MGSSARCLRTAVGDDGGSFYRRFDLGKFLADVAASLGDDGLFVFSILHPSFFGQPPTRDPVTGRWERRVSGYLDHEQRWIESFGGHTHYHRPLSWYVDLLGRNVLPLPACTNPRRCRPTLDPSGSGPSTNTGSRAFRRCWRWPADP